MDQRQLEAAHFWQRLQYIPGVQDIEPRQFNKTVFVLMALWLVERSGYLRGRLPSSLLRKIRALIDEYRGLPSDRLQGAAQEVVNALFHHLDYVELVPQLVVGPGIIEAILDALHEHLAFAEYSLYFADSAFFRSIARPRKVGSRSTVAALELAAQFLPIESQVGDYFLETGEFAIRAAHRGNSPVQAIANYVTSDEGLLRLRLALHEVSLDLAESNDIHRWDDRVLLLSHPTHRASRAHHSYQTDQNAESALEALTGLANSHYKLAIAAIPKRDTVASGWRQEFRRFLVESGRLLAVVSGISPTRTGSSTQPSLWVVAGDRVPDDRVLFIDVTEFVQEGSADMGDLMHFVADIISLLPHAGNLRDFDGEMGRSGQYEGRFSREFRSGYRNVRGLCKYVRRREIEVREWSLTPLDYIAPAAPNATRPLLDGSLLMDLLRTTHSIRAYIIGNNGRGKSLLLAQLAGELAEAGISSSGLSFGLTDRFQFHESEQPRDHFSYLGARTSETSISLQPTKNRLQATINILRSNPPRLRAFKAALRTLGFGDRLYLIPRSINIHMDTISDESLAQIEELTETRALAESEIRGPYSLGIIRELPRKTIVLFERLSSGEQQLITMVAKLSARAERGTVMLVDEPELSLHVSWQRAIPAMLAELCQTLSCSVVVATHSPVLIANALDKDHCFSAVGQILEPIPAHQRPSVESVLFDDFDTYTTNTRRVHELCAALVAETINEVNNGENAYHPEEWLGRLEHIDRVVKAAPAQQSAGQYRDLELISRTRAAIEELMMQIDTEARGTTQGERGD